MAFLKYLCPVKLFNSLFKTEKENSFAFVSGYTIFLTSFTSITICDSLEYNKYLKPLAVSAVIGAASIMLSLENKRMLKESKIDSETEGREPPSKHPGRTLSDEDIAECVRYLASNYYSFYNIRMGLELAAAGIIDQEAGAVGGAEAGAVGGAEAGAVGGAEAGAVGGAEAGAVGGAEAGAVGGAEAGAVGEAVRARDNIRQPNIPLEFALAFGQCLVNVLKLRTRARANKICPLPDRQHFLNWVYDVSDKEVDDLDKTFYAQLKQLLKKFRKEQDQFNRSPGPREIRRERVLLYCRTLDLLSEYHSRFQKVLKANRQRTDRFVTLPTLTPEMQAAVVNQPEVHLVPPRINLRNPTPSPPPLEENVPAPPLEENVPAPPLEENVQPLVLPAVDEPIPFRLQDLVEDVPPIRDPRIDDVAPEVVPPEVEDEGFPGEISDSDE